MSDQPVFDSTGKSQHLSVDEFARKLASEVVEESVLDAFVAASKKNVDADEVKSSEAVKGVFVSPSDRKDLPFDVRIVDFFLSVFSLKNMVRCVIFLLGFMIASTIWDIIEEVYSRPTILKPRSPRPFFSNKSSTYLTDFYDGKFHPEKFVNRTDLLVVMYYAPWSYHSHQLKHPFEVVAFVFKNHKNIRFVAANCWETSGECRTSFKIYQFPVLVAYSSSVFAVYQGEFSSDHIYRWIVNVRNPLRHIRTVDEMEATKRECHTVVVGYFPFKSMEAPSGYRAFAAAGMALQSGTSEDQFTCAVAITSKTLAQEMGMRYEGDIKLYILEDVEEHWSRSTATTAQSIADWVRRKRNISAPVKWIHSNHFTEIMTNQFALILSESAVLLLVTSMKPLYNGQKDVILFTELAREYWNCKQDDLLSIVPRRLDFINMDPTPLLPDDKKACVEALEGVIEMDACCRSLVMSVDWNMACASSAHYHWEDDEYKHELAENQWQGLRKRRSHWTEQVLVATRECVAVRNGTLDANILLSRCCRYYEDITIPEVTVQHKAIRRKRVRDRELMLADCCIRGRFYEYMKYPDSNETLEIFDELEPSANSSVRGMGCRTYVDNDTLKFAILDSLRYPHFLKKWGLAKAELPSVIVIDNSRELFSVMDGPYTQKRVREFIHDHHSSVIYSNSISEEDIESRFAATVDTEQVHQRVKDEQVLQRLTQRSFHALIESRQNTSHDVVVLFSGGVWHTPSMNAMHVYHSAANYFSSSPDLIKFYMIDVSRNELPYNFNFDHVPAVVIFLANQTDISWKYPESLPFSQPNLLSFILSHGSARLRWKMALTNCGRICVSNNRRRLRKRQEKLLRTIHRIRESPYRALHETKLRYFVKQLWVIRRVLVALNVALHQSEVLAGESVNNLLHTSVFEEFIRS